MENLYANHISCMTETTFVPVITSGPWVTYPATKTVYISRNLNVVTMTTGAVTGNTDNSSSEFIKWGIIPAYYRPTRATIEIPIIVEENSKSQFGSIEIASDGNVTIRCNNTVFVGNSHNAGWRGFSVTWNC